MTGSTTRRLGGAFLRHRTGAALLASMVATASPVLHAADEPASPAPRHERRGSEHGPILELAARAERDVLQDSATVVMYVEREAPTPAGAQSQVNGVLSPALADLRRDHRDLEVSTGAFRTDPVYSTPRDGSPKITGWRARASLQITGKPDESFNRRIGELTSRLNIESIQYTLSRDARQQAEQALIAEAVKAFQGKATAAAQALGFRTYEIRKVSIDGAGRDDPPPGPRVQSMQMRAAADAAPPLAGSAGMTTVSVGVSGSVRLQP